jgi:L-alanine-DL-glutamate epimerase-like enolase superfamily enzyme
MKLAIRRFDLPTRHPFSISRATTTVQPTLLVELEQDGVRGYGEAPECAYYDAMTDSMTTVLERVRPQVEAARLDDPADFWDALQPALASSPFAQCALDTAAYDLWGRLRRAPVWKLWGLSLEDVPPSDYTIGIDTIDVMIDKLRELPDWPVYKIKLGTTDDLGIVRRLREHTQATFRVDANCAWAPQETIDKAAALKTLGVQFIEQPLPPDDWQAMRRVYQESALSLVADESCRNESDVERCAGHFHGVNVKLAKCGGLTPAKRMIAQARSLGLQVMVGCFTESTVGISAAAQLLPLVDYADIDGPLLLAQDLATGVVIERGRVEYPQRDGCGVELTGRLRLE